MSAGVDVIAHALDETAGLTPEHLTRMRQRKMALIPTLTLFAEDRDAPAIFKEVGDFAALGGDLLFGTDVGFHQMYGTVKLWSSCRLRGPGSPGGRCSRR